MRRRRSNPLERALRAAGRMTAGVDEVGRGPLAGPVVACAIIMPPSGRPIRGVNDSKQLSPAERDQLYPLITGRAVAFALGAASVREIERDNPLQATVRAMHRALSRLPFVPENVLIDGRRLATLEWEYQAIVHGDASCYCIACASVVAKVTRDRLMRLLSVRYPGYGWEHNSGYGTSLHLEAIERMGPSPHHRATFLRAERGPKTGDGKRGRRTGDGCEK